MTTQVLSSSPADIERAGALLRAGELVAIPTETVYGLAADACNSQAVAKIFVAKGRPQDNPLIVHIAQWEQLATLVEHIPPAAQKLADVYWPGPLTMILKKTDRIPPIVSGGLPTVAVRLPAHPVARAIIQAAGCPLAAPSANLSGSPSPTTAAHVLADLQGRIAAVVDGGHCGVGLESTVVDLTREPPRLLRPGGITAEWLRELLPDLVIDPAVTANLAEGQRPASPGMKYKHYAPKARVILVRGNRGQFADYVNRHAGQGVVALCFDGEEQDLQVPAVTYGPRDNPEQQAHRLFEALRQLDEIGAETVYAACPDVQGLGLAVYNRLLRAAAFQVVTLM